VVVRLRLIGGPQGGPRRIVALEKLPGTSNYFIGNLPQDWHADIPRFAKVLYEDAYPGVNVVYRGTQEELETDFVVAPG